MQRIILDTPEDLEKINVLLQQYKGYPVVLWVYIVSLSQLELRIKRGAAGNFHLQFTGVMSIMMPKLYWKLDGFVEYKKSGSIWDYHYKFIDESSSISIVSGPVRLTENVDPLFS